MSVSAALGLQRTTRILAIPLSRPLLGMTAATTTAARPTAAGLTYYQFQLTSDDPETIQRAVKKAGLPKWVSNLSTKIRTTARNTWAGFGRAQGGWKLKTYQFGERLVDRMDFEELALRTVDPNLCPWPLSGKEGSTTSSLSAEKQDEQLQIPLLYPPSKLTGDVVLSELHQHLEQRIKVHKRRLYFWMLVTPLTAPFIIIPIIPNLPFIFCVWRSITHWETLHASRYLKLLIDKDCLIPEPSESLDAVYKEHAPIIGPSTESDHELLLTENATPEVVGRFDLDEAARVDLGRALGQAKERMESGKLKGGQ